jgi:pyruvate/2-oxoglutarate dehydrogenase complex dihydrolipoamide dehydrogenase (E3) component
MSEPPIEPTDRPEADLGGLDPELAALLEPHDEYNLRLLDQVHPLDWTSPEPADRYHLVVVGAGTAGLVSAAGAAGLGARVALVEKRLMGGDCLNTGCVPSKAILRAAHAFHEARLGAERFGAPAVTDDGDFGRAMERMRRLRAAISRHDSARRFRDLGVDVFIGEGRFVAPDAVEVDGKRLRFRRAILATGATPRVPPIEGLSEAGYLTSESFFTLTRLPRRLGVIGGGPIGCEMAQAFARFGSEVTLFEMGPHLLPREEPETGRELEKAFERDGIRLELDIEVRRVESTATGKCVSADRRGTSCIVEVDELLIAAGRVPVTHGLGLEAAGVETDRGRPRVDDRLRTTNRRVFAVGDVATGFQFTHIADAMARIALQNALFFGRLKMSDLVIPRCTYTSPEVAHVGLTPETARSIGREVQTVSVEMDSVDRAILDDAEAGFLNLYVEKGKDRILGATLVAERAGDLIAELCLAVTHRIGLSKIASTIHPYPTQAEVIKKAADAWRRGKLTPFVQKVFTAWFRIFR